MAADNKLRKQLLEVGPYCVAESGITVYCSPNATRTQRSGLYDLKYMARDDRHYWCADFPKLPLHALFRNPPTHPPTHHATVSVCAASPSLRASASRPSRAPTLKRAAPT